MENPIRISIKPLSVNDCWKGRRFKTPEYSNYERSCLFLLPVLKLGLPPYKVSFEFGMSNTLSDFDNPVKPICDIMQKKYKFNDRDIHEASIKKVLVDKGSEYFEFKIDSIIK